jgi:hypothetical protein
MPLPRLKTERIDLSDEASIARILKIQKLAYSREAEHIGCADISAFFDTKQTILNSGEQFTGLLVANQLVGMISTLQSGRVLEICRLVVHPKHTRKKYATKLLG